MGEHSPSSADASSSLRQPRTFRRNESLTLVEDDVWALEVVAVPEIIPGQLHPEQAYSSAGSTRRTAAQHPQTEATQLGPNGALVHRVTRHVPVLPARSSRPPGSARSQRSATSAAGDKSGVGGDPASQSRRRSWPRSPPASCCWKLSPSACRSHRGAWHAAAPQAGTARMSFVLFLPFLQQQQGDPEVPCHVQCISLYLLFEKVDIRAMHIYLRRTLSIPKQPQSKEVSIHAPPG